MTFALVTVTLAAALVSGFPASTSGPGSYIQACTDPQPCAFSQRITVPEGDYYMMGDNRGNSDDSLYWEPVPQSSIIGTAFFTYCPPSRIGTV